MSLGVFLAVIASSFFQAWWNFRLKKLPVDRAAFLVVGWLFFGVVSVPISLFFLGQPFDISWLHFIVATGLIQGLYVVVLSAAYHFADISLIFPLARGLGVSMTTLAFVLLLGAEISWLGALGIGSVVVGALCTSLHELKNKKSQLGILMAVILSLLVASYSILDSFGAQKVPIIFYVLVMNITASLFAVPWLYKSKKSEFIKIWRSHKWLGFCVGFAGSAAYLVVVWAYTRAPVHYVLALREVSIVFAVFMGVQHLNEPLPKTKALGIVLIMAGILCIKFA